jgi:hypothetical protein
VGKEGNVTNCSTGQRNLKETWKAEHLVRIEETTTDPGYKIKDMEGEENRRKLSGILYGSTGVSAENETDQP